ELGFAAAARLLVEGEEVAEDEGEAPAVQEQVVEAPDEAVLALAEAQESRPLERGTAEVEAAGAVGGEPGGEPLLPRAGRSAAPVLARPGDLDAPTDDLEWPPRPGPDARRAQRPAAA